MLSKCANPECSEQFRYLYQGKLYCLIPTPEVQAVGSAMIPTLYERFWLCARCSKTMTLIWGGTQALVVPLPPKPVSTPELLSTKPEVTGSTPGILQRYRG